MRIPRAYRLCDLIIHHHPSIVDMFQYPDLNKRLVYILLEAYLCKVSE